MRNTDPFRKKRFYNINPKHIRHSTSMSSFSINKSNILNSKIGNEFIKINKRKKKEKILSKSSINILDGQNFIRNNQIKDLKKSNIYGIKNKNSTFLKYSRHLRLNSSQNQNIYPNIYLNKNKIVNNNINNIKTNNNYINNNNKRQNNNYPTKQEFNRDTGTFYSISNNDIANFILDKRIKIINNTYNTKYLEEKENIKNNENAGNICSTNKKLKFNRLLPNDLKIYKEKLFSESSNKNLSQTKSQDFIPSIEPEKFLSNSKINSSITNSKINQSKSRKSDEEKTFENIELNGVVTKVMTKLKIDDDIKKDKNDGEKIDFHYLMKHPFKNGTYGYDFLKNCKNEYKIYENPFDDKELIFNIHNLIINPNLKKFRNDNLIIGADFYPRKNTSAKQKNYKLLSKQGFKKLQNEVMQNLKKNVEDNISHMDKIKVDLDILMERNIKKFKEQREELINDEI